MRRFWPVFKWLFVAWGSVSLIGVLILMAVIAFSFLSSNRSSSKTASKQDVRFVLNWCGLGDDRIEEVTHSYISSRSFTGDHLDAYAIRISHVDISELTKKDDSEKIWYRCDQAEGIMEEALVFVRGWLGSEIPWFPSYEELKSSDMYVYPWSIYTHGTRPTAVELIFIRPKDKMVFYFGCKM
jgi:hypothetical protein